MIFGSGFGDGATVTFGGQAATSVVVVDSTRISCVTPAHALGSVDVIVTNPDNQTATLTKGFLYRETVTEEPEVITDPIIVNGLPKHPDIPEDLPERPPCSDPPHVITISGTSIIVQNPDGQSYTINCDGELILNTWAGAKVEVLRISPTVITINCDGTYDIEYATGTTYPNDLPESDPIHFLTCGGDTFFALPKFADLKDTFILTSSRPTNTGWWLSVNDKYNGAAGIVSNSTPKDSRSFRELDPFTTGSAGMFGGFPGSMATYKNHLVYAPGGYTVGTDSPTIRIFDGSFDRELATIPNTSAGAIPKAVLSVLVAEGVIYLSTYDAGTTSSTWAGRVFTLDVETGVLITVGDNIFTAGHLPYALAWHMGRLWVGTHRKDPSVSGKIYFFRPGIDTVWTLDHNLTAESLGSVSSLLSFQGLLYVGTTAKLSTFAQVLVRGVATTYTASDTGTGGTARDNNGYLALAEFQDKLYASYWNPDTTAVSKIKSFNGTTWSTVYTGAGATNIPYVGFPTDRDTLLAIGGGRGYQAALVSTVEGTGWVDRTAFLTQLSPVSTGLPAFGVVMR